MSEKLDAIKEKIQALMQERVIPFFKKLGLVVGLFSLSLFIGWVIAAIIGLSISKNYMAERVKTYNYPIEIVWGVLTNVEGYHEWKYDVTSVEIITEPGQTPVEYMEYYKMKHPIRFQLITQDQVSKTKVWEVKIAGSSVPIQSKWLFKLTPYKQSTIVTMKQLSEIDSAFGRFTAKYLDKFMDNSDGFLFAMDRRLRLIAGDE